jgi:hypothetical protein
MQNRTRFVVGGAVAGALVGALGGWVYSQRQEAGDAASASVQQPVTRSQLMRLVTATVAVVRQVLELGS